MEKDNPQFQTTDLNTAAFLKSKNIPLTDVRWQGLRMYFCFDHPAAELLALKYLNGGEVSATTFAWALQELKTLVHARMPRGAK